MREFRYAWKRALPILLTYFFLAAGFGIMLQQAGLGSVFGAVMGAAIPFDFEGIDFLMTALFVTIVIDQWKRSTQHFPAILGFVSSIVFLLLVGAANFMLPTLVFTTVILTVSSRREAKEAIDDPS